MALHLSDPIPEAPPHVSTLPQRLTSDSDFASRRECYDLNRRYYHGDHDRLPAQSEGPFLAVVRAISRDTMRA
jgi:hypothetical protein